jgi:hypothetical protein
MTDSRRTHPSKRRGRGNGLGWKSGLLASSVGAVLVGWALLGQMEAAPKDSAAAIAPPEPQVLIVDLPVAAPVVRGIQQLVGQMAPASATSKAVQVVPSMPQKPVFQRPVTRTRGS